MITSKEYDLQEYKRCAGRDCKNQGSVKLKIKYVAKTGYFCSPCAESLIDLDLAIREDNETSSNNESRL